MILAIDPGAAGGIAAIHREETKAVKMPGTDREIMEILNPQVDILTHERTAYLEDLVKYTGRNMPSSAMAVYAGNWGFIRGVLTTLGYRIVLVHPKKWIKALSLGEPKSHANKTAWKNHLKQAAERLYPQIKVTLATADALLILEAARRGLIG